MAFLFPPGAGLLEMIELYLLTHFVKGGYGYDVCINFLEPLFEWRMFPFEKSWCIDESSKMF